ncbi:molybdopterin molybdotransferase MoeA [Cocleimonas flava]|uniref:Molybdopterin molybdenumtransferase n=1 Tax=Cocleimonas flava TaxID=634765 RepID=A0A4R1F555_9GAMM|nr:gephyrin-like molybdotransferase Glp [Cocleimonas flava]TCJ87734.1 molybdopterin molybdotransferase [Cocleimonas flava]
MSDLQKNQTAINAATNVATSADDSCDYKQTLLAIDDVLNVLRDKAKTVNSVETISVLKARTRILAEDITSTINVPPADNSAMDGYAFNAADIADAATTSADGFDVSQRICAGDFGEPLNKGTVARIFTGAPIPAGADTVVMQENCDRQGDKVVIQSIPQAGSNVRKAGEDIKQGDVILKAGHKLRPQDLGLVASVGISELSVKRRLKVAIFFTGDELRQPGETLGPGQIYNSNRFTLNGLLESLNCEVIDLGIIEDNLAATEAALLEAAAKADLVMTSGGVSVGEEDHIRKALEANGELGLWRVNIKPGKPFVFGEIHHQSGNTAFMGLPGNPVSVFATFCIFARPYILKKQGSNEQPPKSFMVESGFEINKKETRNEYLRARLDYDDAGKASITLYPNQSSGVLTSASWGNGFAFVPAQTLVSKGDLIQFTPFSELSIG